MAGITTEDSSLLRAKLEFPVWHRSFTKSYTAWSNAPSDLKTPLLLSGPALAKAEVWLLACPEKLTDSQKRYIVRSISQKAREPTAGPNSLPLARGKVRTRWYRTSDRSLWHLYAVIGLGLFVFAPEYISDSMERALNSPETLQEIQRQRKLAAGKSGDAPAPQRTANSPEAGLADADPSEPTSDAPRTTAQAPETETEPETEHAALPDPPPPAPAPAEPPAQSRADRLASLAAGQLASGQYRQGILLAIEAAEIASASNRGQRVVTDNVPATAQPLLSALATKTTLAPLVTPTETSRAVLFCADGATMVTATSVNEASVWTDGGRRTAVVAGLERGIDGIAVDRDCRRFAVPNSDFNVELRPLAGDNRPIVHHGHSARILHTSISRDGLSAVTSSQDSTARIWETRSGRLRAVLSNHDWHVLAAEFSPDGRHVLTASADKTARVWNASTGQELFRLAGHQGSVTTARYSHDGRRILTVSWDGMVRLFDAATGSQIAILRSQSGSLVGAVLNTDGSRIATIGSAGQASLWQMADAQAPVEVAKFDGAARQLEFSTDGRWLAVLDWSGTLRLLAGETGAAVMTFGRTADPLVAMSFSSRSPEVVAVGRSGSRYSWPIVTSVESALAMGKAIAPPCLSADERFLLGLDGEIPAWCAEIKPRGAALPQ